MVTHLLKKHPHSPCTAEPSGVLLSRPCNASRRALRLPNCVRLDAASQAAAGTAASPQPRSRAPAQPHARALLGHRRDADGNMSLRTTVAKVNSPSPPPARRVRIVCVHSLPLSLCRTLDTDPKRSWARQACSQAPAYLPPPRPPPLPPRPLPLPPLPPPPLPPPPLPFFCRLASRCFSRYCAQ